jgi:protein PhnA
MEDEMKACPQCNSLYGYFLSEELYACPECNHEWNPAAATKIEAKEETLEVKDANGNLLQNGDSIVVIKTLAIKGASGPLKAGTKVRRIRLTEGDHNISCRIDGFGAMALKSEFVKKA